MYKLEERNGTNKDINRVQTQRKKRHKHKDINSVQI